MAHLAQSEPLSFLTHFLAGFEPTPSVTENSYRTFSRTSNFSVLVYRLLVRAPGLTQHPDGTHMLSAVFLGLCCIQRPFFFQECSHVWRCLTDHVDCFRARSCITFQARGWSFGQWPHSTTPSSRVRNSNTGSCSCCCCTTCVSHNSVCEQAVSKIPGQGRKEIASHSWSAVPRGGRFVLGSWMAALLVLRVGACRQV